MPELQEDEILTAVADSLKVDPDLLVGIGINAEGNPEVDAGPLWRFNYLLLEEAVEEGKFPGIVAHVSGLFNPRTFVLEAPFTCKVYTLNQIVDQHVTYQLRNLQT